jgi:hypothetical protein
LAAWFEVRVVRVTYDFSLIDIMVAGLHDGCMRKLSISELVSREGSSVPFGLDPTQNRKFDSRVQRAEPITHCIVGLAQQQTQTSPLR